MNKCIVQEALGITIAPEASLLSVNYFLSVLQLLTKAADILR
jgi:hypothetical protein